MIARMLSSSIRGSGNALDTPASGCAQ